MKKKHKKKISSGGVLLIVLVVLLIFVLTASVLLPVIFGLILAYFFLPLQLWIKKRVLDTMLVSGLYRVISIVLLPITYPLKKLRTLLPKKKAPASEPIITPKEQKELFLINHSCRITVLLVIFLLSVFLFTASLFSTTYFAYATKSVKGWIQQTKQTYEIHKRDNANSFRVRPKDQSLNNSTVPEQYFNAFIFRLESLKPKLEEIPLFQTTKKRIREFLSDPENLKKIVFRKGAGVFSFLAGFIGTIAVLIINLVFTFFFFAFFLWHMARFNNILHEKATAGEHIVSGLFKSGWMPKVNKGTKNGTIKILDNIFARLHSWVRGYLTIIIIESVFYVTTFLLAGVPYGIILGLLAGCTVLLPFIGPMSSFLLTAIVCLTVGGGGMIQVTIVALLYIIMTVFIEEFFLYPTVVGHALGLNEFETIVFVILGGIIAGIPGLIFAVPVASILKYLIPEVYNFWQNRKKIK